MRGMGGGEGRLGMVGEYRRWEERIRKGVGDGRGAEERGG